MHHEDVNHVIRPRPRRMAFSNIEHNRQRNKTFSQRAAIAVEATEVLARIRAEAAKNVGGRPRMDEKPTQLIGEVSAHTKESSAKAAALFGTNRQYDKARIQTEANAARSEKAKAGEVGRAAAKKKEMQFSDNTTCVATKQKRENTNEGYKAAASATGTNRGDVQRWTQIENLCAELGEVETLDTVRNGKTSAALPLLPNSTSPRSSHPAGKSWRRFRAFHFILLYSGRLSATASTSASITLA